MCVVVGSCYNPLPLPLPVAGTSDEASTRCWEVMKLKMREDPKWKPFSERKQDLWDLEDEAGSPYLIITMVPVRVQ